MSGTSATRTSPPPTGRASSTSAGRACTSSPTASRCARECRSRRCGSGCTRSRTNPTWCPTGPLTTTAPGDSACPIASCSDLQPGEYDVVIDSTLEPGHLTYAELRLERDERGRGADLDVRVPSLAGQRQPLRDRGRDDARARSCRNGGCGTRTASCSRPARSDRWRGFTRTATRWIASSTAWRSPASATPAA